MRKLLKRHITFCSQNLEALIRTTERTYTSLMVWKPRKQWRGCMRPRRP